MTNPADAQRRCSHGHAERKVGCVSCVMVFDWPAQHAQEDAIAALREENARLLTERDTLREAAFKAGFDTGICAIDKFGEQQETADEAYAAWTAALKEPR